MDGDEYRDVIRAMIQHEDTLRDQRLGWFLTLNGLLFAGLSFAWGESDTGGLVAVLGVVGVVVGVSATASMVASHEAVRSLADSVEQDPEAGPPSSAPVIALRSAHFAGLSGVRRYIPKLYPWDIIPRLLIVVWAVVPVLRSFA